MTRGQYLDSGVAWEMIWAKWGLCGNYDAQVVSGFCHSLKNDNATNGGRTAAMTRERYLDPIIAREILVLEMKPFVGPMTRRRYLDSIIASRALLYEHRTI